MFVSTSKNILNTAVRSTWTRRFCSLSSQGDDEGLSLTSSRGSPNRPAHHIPGMDAPVLQIMESKSIVKNLRRSASS